MFQDDIDIERAQYFLTHVLSDLGNVKYSVDATINHYLPDYDNGELEDSYSALVSSLSSFQEHLNKISEELESLREKEEQESQEQLNGRQTKKS